MKGLFLTFLFIGISTGVFCQVAKGTGIFYFTGEPTLPVNLCYDGEVGIDTSTGLWYEYSRDFGEWIKAGFRVQLFDTCAKPTYIPADKQSEVVLNNCDSLYRFRAGSWYHLNPAGGGSGATNLSFTGTSSPVTLNSSTGTDVTFTQGGIVTITATSGNMTISATEVDGSVTNELQTLANTSDATSHTVTLSNSGGSIQLVEGANVTLSTTGTGLDGIVTIAATSGSGTDLSFTGTSSPVTLVSNTGTDVTFTQGGIVTITATSSNITISATEVDGSVTNEGILGVGAGSGTSSVLLSNTSGATGVTINAAGILAITESTSSNGGSITLTATEVDGSTTNEIQTYSHSGTTTYTNTLSSGGGSWSITGAGIAVISQTGGAVTVTATEVDGSTTNELQTIANTSDATSHTVTLSNSGGSVQLVEGLNVTLTTTGTSSAGIVTINAATGPGTDLSFTGTSSPVTLNSSTGNDVTFTQSGIVTIIATSGNLTISATEVDGSTTNELQTYSHSGTTTYTNTLSGGGGSWSITGAGIAVISQTGGAVTVTATEVDGSVTNELQTLANTSDATSHTVTLSSSGGSVQLVEGANVTLTTSGTGSAGIVTIASTEVDGSTTNELQTYSHSGTTTYTNTLSGGGGSWSITGAGIAVISQTAGAVTVTATEVDGSVTNEGILGVGAGSGTSSVLLSNTSGATGVTINAAGILAITESTSSNGGSITLTATEVDGSTTNELQTYSHSGTTTYTNTLSGGGGSWSITGAGIAVISQTGGAVTVTATEVDGSTTNELQTYSHSGTSTYTNTLSGGGGSWSITGAGIAVISQTGGAVTVTATEVDGSTSNELQTLANTSDATSHTVTLSNSGGSVQLVEGANVTLTTSGTGSAGIVTIAATSGSGTDLSVTGTSSPVTLNSSTGTDVTFTQSGIVTITATSSNITISATEVDGSVTNELQTYSHSGTTTYTNTLSSGGGSWSITGAGIAVISQTAGAVTVTATEVDGSVTNEGILGVGAGSGTSSVLLSNTSGATGVTINAAGILAITESTSSNGGSITLTATEVDGSTTNEIQTYSHSGTTTYTNTLSGGGGSWSITGAGIAVISQTAGAVTVTATEVDGSTTNELQTIANTSDATSHTVTLSSSGGSVQLVEGANITLTTTGTSSAGVVTIAAASAAGTDLSFTGTSSPVTLNSSTGTDVTFTQGGIVTITATSGNITISATEVDGSTTNELQTYSHSGTTTYTNTLSSGGGSWSITGAGIAVISQTGGAVTVTATEVDGSTTNELQTYSHSGTTTYTNTLSGGGGSWSITGAGIAVISQTAGAVTVTATEVDGSTTNELQTYSHSGTTTYTNTLSGGGGSWSITGAGIAVISQTGGAVTVTATEVDGSVTNEGILGVGAGSGTSSVLLSNTSGATGVTINAAGILAITESTSSNGGSITLTATEVDGSTSNELQTLANTSDATSHTVTLSNSGGSVQLVEGTGITLTTTGTSSAGIVTIASTATGTVTGAENGLNVVSNKVRLGGNLITAATSIEGDGNELRFFDGKFSLSSWTGFANTPVQFTRIQSVENSPTLLTTPTEDGITEFRLHSSAGSDQSNSLTIGGYATDADGMWLQSRSAANPSVKYPLSLQPRGGQMSVGRLTGLSALVTFTGNTLTGSTAAGSVLLLENSEGNGKTSLAMGSGSNNVGGELAMFHATDALRVINRNSTNGTTSVRVSLGGETSDVATFQKSAATTLVNFGVGTTAPHSTLQSAGSLATAYLETVGAPTFDETKRTVVYTASTNISWTLPSAATCACPGREYVLHHAGTAGTITLSQSITKGNGGNFSTLVAGEWAMIFYGSSSIRGFKKTSD